MIASARLHIDAMLAFFRRDLAVFLSYRTRVFTQYFGILFQLALFFYISKLIVGPPFTEPGSYFSFAVIGFVIFAIVRSTLGLGGQVRQELVAGTYERVVLSPLGSTVAAAGMMIFPLCLTFFIGFVELMIAVTVFGIDLRWDTAALAIPLGLLGAMAFVPFALIFGALMLAFKQAPGQGVVLAVISFVSGLYFPIALLPHWIQWLSDVQPFTPSVDLLRNVLVGMPLHEPAGQALLKVMAFAFLLTPITAWMYAEAGKIARRRGTITEY